MTLELKNIGMIKEANVKIDGLTVIAGENDTGKSTVGKRLQSYIRYTNMKLRQIYSIYFRVHGKSGYFSTEFVHFWAIFRRQKNFL